SATDTLTASRARCPPATPLSAFSYPPPAPPGLPPLSLHDALPIYDGPAGGGVAPHRPAAGRIDHGPAEHPAAAHRSAEIRRPRRAEEHTSELQSRFELVCRLLLEKKKAGRRWARSARPTRDASTGQ